MQIEQKDKLVCVFGLGKTGLAAARYLQRINQKFVVADTRENPPGIDEIRSLDKCQAMILGDLADSRWQRSLDKVDTIILSPGVDPRIDAIELAKTQGKKVVSDIEVFANNTKGKIIAITGSNGKSTVTDLTHKLLIASGTNAKIGGNFGIPVLDFLPEDSADVYVLELSSFQLDITESLSADVATVLNITEDHMDRYESFQAYVESKLTIYNQAKSCLANADDKLTIPEKAEYKTFSLNEESANYHLQAKEDSYWLTINSTPVVDVKNLTVGGRHNWSNALASLGLINELAIKIDEKVLSQLSQYKGLAHRFEKVAHKHNIEWINDSKATNVGATVAAIKSVDQELYSPVILIAGGDAKNADLSELAHPVSENIDHLILFGKDAQAIASQVQGTATDIVKNMQEAVNLAQQIASKKASKKIGLVLLSPACASLDMYANFEARGEDFKHCVEALV